MDTIKLKARYGLVHQLKHIADNCWQLECDPTSSGTFRIISQCEPFKIEAIDPEGGPFLSVGDSVENYIITDIMADGIIYMKQNEVSD